MKPINVVIILCVLNGLIGINCDQTERLKAVEEYYKWRELAESPVQAGHSKGPSVSRPRLIEVDRSGWEWRKPEHQQTTEIKEIVLPYEGFQYDPSKHLKQSYVIENRRYVEDLTSRCTAATVPTNPMLSEPSFIIISPAGDIRLEATIPADLVKQAGFDPSKGTIIIVHGYTQSYPFSPYLRQMRKLFDDTNKVGSQNLIIMDYSMVSWSTYQQTAAATNVIGSFLANFIYKLLELGADRKSIHLIGNSIGAHVASFAGKRIRPKIGRITSLDTAGPCFGRFGIGSEGNNHGLSVDDAEQVVVIHFDDELLGTPGQHGHLDIFVNGGKEQPGCRMSMSNMILGMKSVLLKEDKYVESSHTRGQELFTSALPDWCQQVAYECKNYDSFTRGECGRCDDNNGQCYLMSMYFQFKQPVDTALNPVFAGKRLYISTGPNKPYCSNHYQILVEFGPSVGKAKKTSLELFDKSGQAIKVLVKNESAPNQLSHLLLLDRAPVRFETARIQLQPIKIESSGERLARDAIRVRLNFMSNIDPKVRRSFSSNLCLKSSDSNRGDSFDLIQCE